MIKYKYKVTFKTDFSKGECDGDVQAKDSDAATRFLIKQLAWDLSIEESDIKEVNLTVI